MIPILFDTNETVFTNNGLGRLRDCISCVVTEERNGIYECDFEYPIDGYNYDLIQVGRIIGVSHDESISSRSVRTRGALTDEESDTITDEAGFALTANRIMEIPQYDIQPFDIVSFTRPIDGVVTFHCTHISYRQSYMTVTGSNINSLEDAFTLLSEAEPYNPFTYETDKANAGYLASADGVPKTVRSMLGGIEGSILDAYGGEYEWDKFRVILHSERGIHRNFSIRYGVNMLDYNEEFDSSGTYSSCVPYWTDGTTTIVGDRQDSPGSTVTGRGECVPLDVSDKFESQPASKAEVEAMGLSVMNAKNPMIPAQNIHIEFVRLQDMGYENLENLLACRLCDTINVVFPFYKTTGEFKIVKTVWDVLTDRYESMELGDLSVTLAEALGISTGSERTSDMTDFVVEEATSGIWTYRKWNNGIAECWGRYSETLTKYTTVGSFAGYTSSVAFPPGLFVSDSIPTHTYTATVGTGFAMAASGMGTSNTAMTVYALGTASANNQSCVFDIMAKGRWK